MPPFLHFHHSLASQQSTPGDIVFSSSDVNSLIFFVLAVCETFSLSPGRSWILPYQENNIGGQWKRALSSATLVGAGGLGGIVETSIFRAQDAPKYIPGMIGCMKSFGLIILVTMLLRLKFWRTNRLAERGECILEGLAGFRFTY